MSIGPMSNRLSPKRLNFTAIAVAAVLAFGFLGPLVFGRAPPLPPSATTPLADPSRLLSGLPADAVQANAAFRARVLAQFPVGTPEETLKQALGLQGFIANGWFGAKRMTFRNASGGDGKFSFLPCNLAASVTWETDDRSRVSAIDGRLLGTPQCF